MDSAESLPFDGSLITRVHRLSRLAGVAAVMVSILVLLGLIPGVPIIGPILAGWSTMRANAAIGTLAAGVSLCLIRLPGRWERYACRFLAVLTSLIGVITLAEYVGGRDLGIDEWLFRQGSIRGNLKHPGRMSEMSALNLSVLGLVLLGLNARRKRWHGLVQWLTVIPAVISMLSLASYMYGSGSLYLIQRFMSISVQSSLVFLLLCVGSWLARPTRGPMAIVLSDTMGGMMARSLLPILPLLYFGLGRLRVLGRDWNLFNDSFGAAMQLTTSTTITAGLVWWSSRVLARHDLRLRRVAETLKESEAGARQIAEGLPQLVWTLRPDGSCDYLSPQWIRYTGADEITTLGWGLSEFVHPDDREAVLNYFQECLRTSTRVDCEFRLRSASGEYRWFKTLALPLLDETGAVVKWFGTNTDIHDTRLQAEALGQSEARLQRVLSAARLSHWEWDMAADRIVYLNGNHSLFGLQADATFTRYSEFEENVHPDDRARLSAEIKRTITTDVAFDTEFRVVWPDGSIHWLAGKGGVSRDHAGNATRMAGINLDITEKKQAEAQIRSLNEDLEHRVAERTLDLALANALLRESEERYRNVVEDQTELLCRFDSSGAFTFVNDVFCRFFGEQRDALIGHHWQPVVHPDDLPMIEAELARLGPENPLVVIVNRVYDDHQRWRWMEFVNRGFFDANGRLTEIQAVGRDISDRKEAEVEIRRALAAADAATRAKGEFLANMSHEIRTPMNGVIGMTELLLDTPLNPVQRDYSETIRSSGQALLTVINDILDFSKIEAGKMSLEVERFSLRTIMEEVGDLLTPSAHKKGLKLTCNIAPDVPDWLLGDPGRVRQVLMNLAGNAVKFTDRGEVNLEAKLLREDEGSATLKILVHDTGVGIPEARQADVFESFTQVEGGSNRKHGGTGLGLTICRRLVALMDGRIGLESQPGAGSTFWFEIPLGKAEGEVEMPDRVSATDTIWTAPAGTPDNTALPASVSILLAEDNEVNRRVATAMIERMGGQVEAVRNGREAVEALDHTRYDLIFMDVQMPEMDGFAATAAIREAERASGEHIPIIAMTAHAMQGDRERCLEAGMDDYLTKPVQQGPLRQAILHWVLQRREAKSEARVDSSDDHSWFCRDTLRKSCGDDASLIHDVLDLAIKNTPERLGRLGTAIKASDGAQIAWEAHGLKGIFLTIGARVLASNCERLMTLGERGELQGTREASQQIQDQWERLRGDVCHHMESLNPHLN